MRFASRAQMGHAVRVFTGAVGLDPTVFDTAVIIDDPVKVTATVTGGRRTGAAEQLAPNPCVGRAG